MSKKQNKLLKQYEQWNAQQFNKIYRLWEQKFSRSQTLEEFLTYLTVNEVMDVEEYSAKINNIIDVDLNQLSFNRKAQEDLTRATIHNNTMKLVQSVNDDFKEHLRTQAAEAFSKGVSPQEFGKMIKAPPLIKGVNGAKRSVTAEVRNRMIARTEAKRALNASNLIINKERGATHWYAIGFTDEHTCEECIETYGTPEDYVMYPIEDTNNLPPLHPNSLLKGTLVFTTQGFKPVEELTINDKVLTLNPETEETHFVNPIATIKHYEKKATRIYNKWFDMGVTNNHDIFIHQRRDGGAKGRYFEPQFRKPHELTSESNFVLRIKPKINGVDDKDYAFVMAWYLSEGSIRSKNTFKISQEIKENRDIIISHFKQIFDDITVTDDSIIIHHPEWTEYLRQFGKSHEKYIPNDVFKLNIDSLKVFIDNYIKGDGHERGNEKTIFTSSKRLRDGLCYVLILMGLNCSISLHSEKGTETRHDNGAYIQNHDVWCIRIKNSKHIRYSSCTHELIDYDDYAYCVDVPPFHTILTCYNGKICWNGNCRHTAVFVKL